MSQGTLHPCSHEPGWAQGGVTCVPTGGLTSEQIFYTLAQQMVGVIMSEMIGSGDVNTFEALELLSVGDIKRLASCSLGRGR